jgi:hypothetical protein
MSERGAAYWSGPVWNWFSLSYASYFVMPRTLMCGMPEEWQERFVKLMDECYETYDWSKIRSDYMVNLKGKRGRFEKDSLSNYRYPPELPYWEPASE